MEQMLRESLIRHKLCNKQSIIAFTAIPYQIRQTFVSQLPHSSSLSLYNQTLYVSHTKITNWSFSKNKKLNLGNRYTYKKLDGFRPSRVLEALNGDPTAIFEHASVDNIWSFLPVVGNNVLRQESLRGSFQLVQAELRQRVTFLAYILCMSQQNKTSSSTVKGKNVLKRTKNSRQHLT